MGDAERTSLECLGACRLICDSTESFATSHVGIVVRAMLYVRELALFSWFGVRPWLVTK